MKNLNCKKSYVWLFLLLMSCGCMAQQETSCMVLMEAILGTYEGDCKGGLAHGKGTAVGWDTYRGEFKKDPYEVTFINGVERVHIYRNGERDLIEIYPIRRGSRPLIGYLRINLSSGVKNLVRAPYTITHLLFPFEGAVYFEAPNHFMAYTKMCEVEFTINEPGRWIVEIYY